MTAEAAIFICSICGEPAGEICVYCTKDACANHRCTRCKRCSDCCECEIPLSAQELPSEPEALAESPIPSSIPEAGHLDEPIAEAEASADEAFPPADPPPDSENRF